jgi:hypothetical protein
MLELLEGHGTGNSCWGNRWCGGSGTSASLVGQGSWQFVYGPCCCCCCCIWECKRLGGKAGRRCMQGA